MPSLRVKIDQRLEDALAEDLESKGLICLEEAVDPGFLERCRAQVHAMIEQRGERFFSVIQPQVSEGGVFAEIAAMPGFVGLLRGLSRRQHSDASAANFELYSVLRVIAGDEATKGSFEFHYDATVITVLMPLLIPEGPRGSTGELIALPNHRTYRRMSITNVLEKALLQNRLSFRYYRRKYGRTDESLVSLKPGSLYFFTGYRTFHGNLPCQPGQRRATLIFHFGDPHNGDPLTRGVLKMRKLREKRRLHAR